jgi:predicted metal-dependent phosphoesterase TrpH
MKCDFHCHTFYSFDSNASPKEIVDKAIERGIDCLAITDHGEIEGAIEAIEYSKGKPVLIIPGIEVKTKEGDVLGLNVKEKIENGLSAKETIEKIKKLGGMAIIPHPFALFYPFKGNLKEILEIVDGIEVLNASVFGSGNKKAIELAKKYDLPFTCGSDAHFPNFVGKCYLEIEGKNLKVEDVILAIKNKKGKIRGKEANFFEKFFDHSRRNLVKVLKYAGRIKRKI